MYFLVVSLLVTVTAAHNLLFVPRLAQSVVCPDKKHECPTGNTCCPLPNMQFGCCPAPNAVCCPGGKYCCPFGSKCLTTSASCQRGNEVFPWLQKSQAKVITKLASTNKPHIIVNDISAKADVTRVLDQKIGNVMCPDGKSACQTGQTCCNKSNGEYACCQLPNAVCCSDKIHCCPEGDTCDLSIGKCKSGNLVMDLFEKVEALKMKSVMCPDGRSECSDGQTCCPLDGGKYGCCPIPDAKCCSDHVHCCPQGYICDVIQQQCVGKRAQRIHWFKTLPPHPLVKKDMTTDGNVICPDGGSECKTGQTCCKLASGQYGCCPIPKAVCCTDGRHCCPEGTTCDVSSGKCNRRDMTVIDWFKKVPVDVASVKCPDGQSECKTGQTCCKLASGQYGCCPIPKAVCCTDGKHCCPEGTTCDVSSGKCNRGDMTVIDWFEKVPANVGSVKCPDGRSECKTGQTCCKLASGQYGCCPIPKAVCCTDGKHCCPEGTTCDVSSGKCNRGDMSVIDWFEKVPANVGSVKCPDGRSECKTGQTCCKLASGQYGCCPIPKAVCCTDGKHCCPEGTTCDVSSGKCNRGDMSVIDWFEKVPANVGSVKCPDGRSECKTGQTCCKLASGQYGCCPIPKAVCCTDGKHCCPEGTTCDVSSGKCNRGDMSVIDWFEKVPANVGSVKCPDGQSECKTGQTCCKLASGQYGCCPIPKAVCCTDGKHCCPEGTTCDVSSGKCNRGDMSVIDWFEKVPANVGSVKCPDGRSECKTGQTCCKLASGQYGCCPIPKAVCCTDGKHCCPEGTTCDVSSGKCNRGDMSVIDWFEKVPANVGSVKCPDGQSECKTGQTCCKLASGQYGCCPIPKAVCCTDGKHCCPEGTTCDVSSGKCNRGDMSVIDWFEKVPANVGSVKCPDGQSECKTGQTCCKLASGQYGCCPIPKAVCCTDGKHCCPEGTTCDVSSGKCNRGDMSVIDWFEKVPANVGSVKCPDGQSECKTGQTCCKLASGQYGCCPIPKAVCCTDGKHCCPEGTTCDVSSGKCNRGDMSVIDWFEKVPANVGSVKCPDGQSECKTGQTCCKLASGQYGCCPIPKAVCCTDGKHCCPEGTTCDVSSGKCNRGDMTVIDWFEKVPANVGSVKCPDGQSECKTGQTCCKLASGQYGCCPIPKAVCCTDGKHCCPEGTTCDVSSGKCNRGEIAVLDWFEKVPANVESVKCPDSQSECKTGQTCCKLASGQYGCCPIPKAVCCTDGKHCCPEGTTCDVSSGKCNRGEFAVLDWFEKVPANVGSVKCPDGRSECKTGQTCCKLASGQYGCCPIPKAVCCTDGKHCCPEGTTCDVSSGKCNRGDMTVLDWFEKVPANVGSVKCPDGQSECKTGQTCCKLASGQYGCCPIPKAVCCTDGKHCCPEGTTCDVSSGKCNRGDMTILDWFEKVPANVGSVKCPDGRSECKTGQTCCKLASGQYGCCPIPKAVCCTDGKHCCPEGTTYDVSSGKCNRGDMTVLDWFEKVPANVGSVKCPDGQSECKTGQTCCKLASGQYGCCPIPKAVCCTDGKHCCPEGTTCDASSGKCNRGEIAVLDWFEKVPANVGSVKCPDGQSECKTGQTCCKLASGQYGCCPIPKAVCCTDGKHCCPEGTTCDVSSGKCNRGEIAILDWFEKVPANVGSVKCPDGQSECKTGQTCCKLASGQYGCCPIPKAVCCTDGKHCCPEGTTCDVSSGKCNRGDMSVIDWFEKVPANDGSVKCPDGRSECKTGQTCCKLASGQYGCCPIPKAVCCTDGKHCCPEGTTCDVSSGKCNRGDVSVIEWFEKVPANVGSVKCPDGRSECKTGQTCCKLSSGQYGCCPIPKAVCCTDGKHCCPEGTTCDVSSGKCNRGEIAVLDWFEKVPAYVESVKCPDGQSECKTGQTCCKLASGQYGCCPIPKAVCCTDGKHCCPEGTTCDVSSGKCNRGDMTVIDWFEKVPANVGSVKCPDGRSECKTGQTCCKLASGQYGCCPIPKAVCCTDGKHCCPEGTTCDVSSGKCNRGDMTVIDWFEKVPANVGSVKCPDGRSECKTGQTCCKLASGQYGCCPIPKAVCCTDGKHCCPEGTTCDVSSGKCNRGDMTVIDWFEKVPANVGSVKCPDGRSECKTGQTCCKLASGQYGCCPIPKAVCCTDGKHCCPEGTTCDVSSGKCNRGDGSQIAWFTKLEAKVDTITCPDNSSTCKNGQTCCKAGNNKYACCPLAQAICCDDNLHCCPQNTKCNIKTSSCDLLLSASQPLLSLETHLQTVTCPDGQTVCPDKNICCKTGSSGYSCCPYSNGVCCTNSKYCCPHTYVCDEEPGICRIPYTYGLVHMPKPVVGKPLL
ncbi:neurogenic locus notch homolog protein 2-like isoform X12 [Mytilus californianus]|uniref:neurogenic locus notch homolog protein 2-like isoform X12 n=1 Tax=Mytilus californianus TaxID=6549 RepID=UPI00224597C9|nr:neurogenic locus notch homolog protein 2-like isoform X12 [Mytilus californianus]